MTEKKIKILVVDDEQHQLDTVCRGLFLYGYDCQGVLSATDALKALNSPEGDSFDLVLTDLTMPGDSGVHLIDQVLKTKPKFPIIVITGLAATQEMKTVCCKGIPILAKPFEPDGLDKAIRDLLDGQEVCGQ